MRRVRKISVLVVLTYKLQLHFYLDLRDLNYDQVVRFGLPNQIINERGVLINVLISIIQFAKIIIVFFFIQQSDNLTTYYNRESIPTGKRKCFKHRT